MIASLGLWSAVGMQRKPLSSKHYCQLRTNASGRENWQRRDTRFQNMYTPSPTVSDGPEQTDENFNYSAIVSSGFLSHPLPKHPARHLVLSMKSCPSGMLRFTQRPLPSRLPFRTSVSIPNTYQPFVRRFPPSTPGSHKPRRGCLCSIASLRSRRG